MLLELYIKGGLTIPVAQTIAKILNYPILPFR